LIPLFRIDCSAVDVHAAVSVLERGVEWAGGREVEQLEQRIAAYVGVRHCVVMNSGTSALHVALLAHGVRPGDEVIVPSFAFIATANCVLMAGATPVFAEVEEERLGLDPQDVEGRVTSKTRAIVCVHYGGLACRIADLKTIAARHGLILIEDAAEALGTEAAGRRSGSFGHSAILSFCQNKVVSTGEGGALLTDLDDVAARARLLRSHGRADDAAYFTSAHSGDYVALGYNFRLSNILAALAESQMHRLEDIIERRRSAADRYRSLLGGLHGVLLPNEGAEDRHVYQLFTIRLSDGPQARNGLQKLLASQGVASKVYFSPIHLTSFYRSQCGCRHGDLPFTERLGDEVLSLPIWPGMSWRDVSRVCELVRQHVRGSPDIVRDKTGEPVRSQLCTREKEQ